MQMHDAMGFAWLTPHGPAVVTQATSERADASTVHALHDFYDRLAVADIRGRLPSLTIVHDWRRMKRVDPAALGAWRARAEGRKAGFYGFDVFVCVSGNPLLRMVLRSAAVSSKVIAGQRSVRFVDEPGPILASRGIRAPEPGFLDAWIARGPSSQTG